MGIQFQAFWVGEVTQLSCLPLGLMTRVWSSKTIVVEGVDQFPQIALIAL